MNCFIVCLPFLSAPPALYIIKSDSIKKSRLIISDRWTSILKDFNTIWMLQLHYMAIGLTLKNKANFNVCVQVYFFLIRLYCWLLWTVLTWSVNGLITLINGESRISCPFEMMFCLTHTTNEKHAENSQTVGLLRLFF